MPLCPRPAAGWMSVCSSRTTCLQGMTNLILWALAWKLTVYPWHPNTQIAKGNASSSTVNLKWISLVRSFLVSSVWILQCFQASRLFSKPHLLFPGSTTSWICPFLFFKGSQNHHVIPQHTYTGKMTRLILFLGYQVTSILSAKGRQVNACKIKCDLSFIQYVVSILLLRSELLGCWEGSPQSHGEATITKRIS